MVSVRVGSASDTGSVRTHNEDNLVVAEPIFAVADGMGGHAAGEVASALAVDVMRQLASRGDVTPDDIFAAIHTANDAILTAAAEHAEQAGMGTTMTGIGEVTVQGERRWLVFNIGDSRVYHLADGALVQVTTDHSEVAELVAQGRLTPAEARAHPKRNVITRSLGLFTAPNPDGWLLPMTPGERFLICSDGLSNELADIELADVLVSHHDPQQAADALVAAAVEAGGHDNVTVVVVDVLS